MPTALLSAKITAGNRIGSIEHPEVREKEDGLHSYSVLLVQEEDVIDAPWVIWGEGDE